MVTMLCLIWFPLGHLGSWLESIEAYLGRLGACLGASGASWRVSGVCCGDSGASWGVPGTPRGSLLAPLGSLWGRFWLHFGGLGLSFGLPWGGVPKCYEIPRFWAAFYLDFETKIH